MTNDGGPEDNEATAGDEDDHVQTIAMERICCIRCGIIFLMPGELLEAKRHDGTPWYCPNGHGILWRKVGDTTEEDGESGAMLKEREKADDT